MRAFIISLSVTVIIFVLTIINCVCVNNATTSLIELSSRLQASDRSVEDFIALWEEKKALISISSSHEEIHKIDEALAVLQAKTMEKDASGFCEERALLTEYLKQIKEDETVSFDGII